MNSNSETYLLEIENLWKIFSKNEIEFNADSDSLMERLETEDGVAAVQKVSFKVRKGEVFVIMGLSGSGKSTLIRCLPRLIEPSYGTIIIDGENVSEMDQEKLTQFRRTRVAMVFQHYGLLPHRTVIENVSFGLKLRGVEKQEREIKALEAISKVGLKGWELHYPAQLSGGMQQRVGIARALVQETDLLLLDEPFSGLDPLIRREMQEELLRLQEEYRKTMIFVTHDLSEALRLGDRMAVMKDGIFVQTGTPKEIIMHPADDYVQRFVQDEQRITHMVEGDSAANNVRVLPRPTGKIKDKVAAGDQGW